MKINQAPLPLGSNRSQRCNFIFIARRVFVRCDPAGLKVRLIAEEGDFSYYRGRLNEINDFTTN
jgi:hypothetical protein